MSSKQLIRGQNKNNILENFEFLKFCVIIYRNLDILEKIGWGATNAYVCQQGGGRGQKLAKSCLRSLWMPPMLISSKFEPV